jgi:hypothetical protein
MFFKLLLWVAAKAARHEIQLLRLFAPKGISCGHILRLETCLQPHLRNNLICPQEELPLWGGLQYRVGMRNADGRNELGRDVGVWEVADSTRPKGDVACFEQRTFAPSVKIA